MVKAKTTKKWEVGDLVNILSKTDDVSAQKGEIIAIRGGGWYSVGLLQTAENCDVDQEIIKCRGTQLQQLAFDINDGKAVESDKKTSTSKNNNDTSKNASNLQIEITPHSSAIPDANGDGELSHLPSPTIYDFDAGVLQFQEGSSRDLIGNNPVLDERILRQVAHHATYERWVVFTDLHCSPATLDTCLEVLDVVHDTAMQQKEKCGVLFLGDFWHHRGTLRVDCLNAILGALRSWKVPMVMIPGNHDQVTLGGQNHGLTPLENAYRVGDVPGPLVLSHPTRFRNALFVPHVRDINAMKAILSSRECQDSSALFLHAEVKGALMNDMVVSTQGISPSMFPMHKHVYSGHFHNPHSVKSSLCSTIEYVGSPYQISLAEAHQEKQLVVLNEKWECQKRIPISVGRRHFKISSLEELEQIHVELEKVSTVTAEEVERDGSTDVRRGDRIVMSVPKKEHRRLENSEYHTTLASSVRTLRDKGLVVELREVGEKISPWSRKLANDVSDSPEFDEMTPESSWRAYLKDETVRSAISDSDCDTLLRVGLGILQEIDSDSTQSIAMQRNLKLTSVTITGFGPFEDTVEYPLDDRGLVLLRGSNKDYGPDSNGTGKSSLAMATLWGLTGSLDARPSADMKVADVINDNSKTAKVTVEGFINNSPFVIIRSKTASKGDLRFELNDVDLTTQSVKETQSTIEEKLGVDAHILSRVAFYGQHGMNDLLEATDSKLKDELSLLVPLDLWQQATSTARAKARYARKRVDEMEGMIKLRKSDINGLSSRVAGAERARDLKQTRVLEAEAIFNQELTKIQELLDRSADSKLEKLQTELESISSEIKRLSDLYDSTLADKEAQLKPLEDELFGVRGIVTTMIREKNRFEMDVRSNKILLDSATVHINQIQERWSLCLSDGIPLDLKPPEFCPTCNQPLQAEGSEGGSEGLESVQKAMENEINEARISFKKAEVALEESHRKMAECSKDLELKEELLDDLQLNHEELLSRWVTKLNNIQDGMKEKRNTQHEISSQISMVVKESQLISQKEAAKVRLDSEKLNFAHANQTYETLSRELANAIDFLEDLNSQKDEEENDQRILSSIGERFSQRGVQTFILQNAVNSLQNTAQFYLDYLSDGSQRLELSLEAGDKILRNAFVRGADGEFRQRPLSTLSGGQWRRCSLALSFAFAELVAAKGRLRSSLLVLDEPLTHLDRSGRTKFGKLVREILGAKQKSEKGTSGFEISTAIVILQDLSAEELEEAFDGIDTVVRNHGKSILKLDEMSSN
ncbi:unnamed protein product [Pseudo-nitzschia multistriata]|uniref:Calcineurin-like phosphoesterase domain-containing protein n=1 Tax=Pseudo-nitzschia multistriata TaxID=183589 RepID=A0A448ZKB3_9STRA|nr:unnamed protein product [Pseudo-nitzschia multistriata]